MAHPISDDIRIGVSLETTSGTINTTPTWETMRLQSETIFADFNSVDSTELTAERGMVDSIPAGVSVSGNIESYMFMNDTYTSFLSAILGHASVPFTTGTVSNGSTVSTYTYEKAIPTNSNVAGGLDYYRIAGLSPTSVTIDVTPNQPVTWSFAFIGGEFSKDSDLATAGDAEIAGSTYDPPNPLAGTSGGVPFLAEDVSLVTAQPLLRPNVGGNLHLDYTNMSITIDSQNRDVELVGGGSEIALGKVKATIEATVLFDSLLAMNFMVNPATAGSAYNIEFGPSGNTIDFDINQAVVTNFRVDTPETSSDVVAQMTIEGLVGASPQVEITI